LQARSFQTRLTYLAALVSGVILLGFGIAAWILVREQFFRSIDARILAPAKGVSPRLLADNDWRRFEERWLGNWPDENIANDYSVLVVTDPEGTPLYTREGSEWTAAHDLSPWLPTDKDFLYPPPSEEEIDRFVFRPGSPFADDRPLPPFGKPLRGRPHRGEPGGPRGPGGPGRPGGPGGPDGESFTAPPPVPPKFFTIDRDDGSRWRFVAIGNSEATLFSGANLAAYSPELSHAKGFFFVAVPLGLIAIGTGGWLISRRALRPLRRINETVSHVTASGLGERIPVTGHDYREFSQLVDTLNHMMERLETSFHQATRFTADASHELKTPIALMQAEVDSALKNAALDSGEEKTLLNVAEEIQRLKRITQSLLFLSQVDSGRVTLTKTRVNLSDEIEALCEDAEVLCLEAGLTLHQARVPDLTVMADPTLLTQAAQNLLNNAVKYNRQGGSVSCSLTRQENDAHIYFTNTGPGIPEEARDLIFDRFYRVDPARGRVKDGFGLGLNLALEIIRAHDGTLQLTDSSPHHTTFLIRLPLVDASTTEE
jgi:two-component system heavy metal sensor histidine kinase CusS